MNEKIFPISMDSAVVTKPFWIDFKTIFAWMEMECISQIRFHVHTSSSNVQEGLYIEIVPTLYWRLHHRDRGLHRGLIFALPIIPLRLEHGGLGWNNTLRLVKKKSRDLDHPIRVYPSALDLRSGLLVPCILRNGYPNHAKASSF